MTARKFLNTFISFFISFVLVVGLLPSVALASTNNESGTNQPAQTINGESSGGTADGAGQGSSANGSAGGFGSNAGSGAGSGASNGSDQVNNSNQNQGVVNNDNESVASSNGSATEEILDLENREAASLSETQNGVTFEQGIYLMVPASNSGLNYNVSSSQLISTTAPRSDALTVTFNSDGLATIANSDQEVLTAQGTTLSFLSNNGSDTQLWRFIQSSNSGNVVQNVSTQTVLDITSGKIQQGTKVGLYQANKTAAQDWNLIEVGSVIEEMDSKAESSKGLLDENTTYYIETALASNKVVDVASASNNNGANIQLYDFNKTGAQQWRVEYDEKGYVTFYNSASGKALDVASAKAVSGTNVQQYQSNGSYAQKWIVSSKADGTYSIESALWNNLSLDIAGASTANKTNVRIYTANGTSAQSFNLISEDTVKENLDAKAAENASVLPDGVYLIISALSDDKVLDVKSASTANGANVQTYQSNLTNAQKWEVTHDEQGYVTFRNIGSQKVLDITSASIVPKTNVQQYTDNGSDAQKWIVSRNEDGTYSIESALWPNISLDIASASTANGANVQIYSVNGTKAQSFNFLNTEPDVSPCEDLGFDNKYFKIASNLNSSYVIDIASASVNDGANVQLYEFNNTYAQLFTFSFVKTDGDKGYYQIINARSGKALDVDSGNLVNRTNIQQWTADSSNDNQLFSVCQNDDGTYTFINKASGLAVDVANAAATNKANIHGYTPNDTTAQEFNLVEVTDLMQEGVVTLYSGLSSSKAVDVASGSMSSGANVQLYSANGSLAQKWNVTKVADNTYTLQSVRSGMNLAVGANDNVVQETPSGASNQQWVPSISKGQTILKNVETGKVLDVASASTANGANIQVYTANGSDAQLFSVNTVSLLTNGMYKIQAFSNTKFVADVASGSSANGANIQLYSDNDSGAQKWNVVSNADGSYTFKNAANGKAIDLKSANAVQGANIQQYASNGSAAQKWYVEYVDGGGIRIISAVNKNYSIGIAENSYSNGANIELQANSNSPGQKFTFDPTTYVPPMPADQQAMLNRIKGNSSGTQWLIAVDRSTHKVGVFRGSANNWSLQYYWSCTTGAPGSPTITGTYRTTGFKRNALTTDPRAIYCTQIWGGYFFHSILASESELGKSLSHGCIRLPYSAAQWIHSNIYAGTTVVIYN